MILRPVVDKDKYFKDIFKKIDWYLCAILFDYPFEVLGINKKTIDNESNPIISALKSNRMQYVDGVFVINKNISSSTAKAIEKLGGRFIKGKGYELSSKKLPVNVLDAISKMNIESQEKINKINAYYDDLFNNVDSIGETLAFHDEFEDIEKDLHGQLAFSLKKINVIPYEMNPKVKSNIEKDYTNNLKLYVTKFAKQEIPKMRQAIINIATKGYRTDKVQDYLIKEYGVTVRKARFLAEQETRLFVSSYREQRFKENGITMYVWSSMEDSRVRPWHAKLDGTIQSFDNPPIANERGERLNPGQDFGCRCIAIPYIPDDTIYPNVTDLTRIQKDAIKEKRG